ncbi:esterase/lipase family protein [Bacillus chungangensis]|uniref:Triacylglycerol lipase n=1 Tax=Bacillus chungangensis TaxID=587633 RepID=A0ABT9WTN7_9BACI|nr:hypothetical protein [Bacillus chungangensis]MDQ0176493.1 triacylglycerol lipase [Bacillus chungangensis]
MKKNVLLLVLACIFILPLNALAGSKWDPPGNPGEWYAGATPDEVDPAKSPIVFVHGFNSSSFTWTEGNDMDKIAYENGYETAFIDLYPDKNMWDNGKLLAEMLEDVYHHFGKKLVVVAHSKGGVDTQTALVHYNAHPYVNSVITLGSPHHGTQLADLAYSKWAGWLAAIIGLKNDATYSVQTSYMSYYRSETDRHSNVKQNPLYTFSGTSWGSFGGALYWGGLYLKQFGQNDGVITVDSTRLPYAKEVKKDNWDHQSIKNGSSTFSLFRPYLKTSTFDFHTAESYTYEDDTNMSEPAFSYLHGGAYRDMTTETIIVEDSVKKMTVSWISDKESTNLTLNSPSQKEYTDFIVNEISEGIFKGAYEYTIEIDQPDAGNWEITAVQTMESYLLNTVYESDINKELSVQLNKGNDLSLSIQSGDHKIDDNQLEAKVHVEYINNNVKEDGIILSKQDNEQSVTFPNHGEGVYNFTIDLNGLTKNGHPFQRSIIKSVYMDSKGNIYNN